MATAPKKTARKVGPKPVAAVGPTTVPPASPTPPLSGVTPITPASKGRWSALTWIIIVAVITFTVVLIVVIILAIRGIGKDDAAPANQTPAVTGQTVTPAEVPWSDVITVGPGQWSEPVWAPGTQMCFDVLILEGAPQTWEALQEHSLILPWKARGRPGDWIPNNGGDFKGIMLGCADTKFSFRYRFLPRRCSR